MINRQTVKNANYDELSLHSHKSTNQSTERSKQIQVSCSFSRIRDVPSTLWLGFVYDNTSLRRLRRLSQRMPVRQALRRNLPPVVPGAGRSVLVPARTAGHCQWQRLSPPACSGQVQRRPLQLQLSCLFGDPRNTQFCVYSFECWKKQIIQVVVLGTVALEEIDNLNWVIFFSYSVTVFQLLLKLQLLHILKLQLHLQLTDSHFSVISPFQLQLLLTGITLLNNNKSIGLNDMITLRPRAVAAYFHRV